MHGPDAGTGEHGVGGLGNHRHIDTDTIALLHTARLQQVGQAANLLVQLGIGDVLAVGGVVTLPDDGGLVRPRGQVPVDTVDGHVQFAVGKPGGVPATQILFVHLGKRLLPLQKVFGLLGPEGLRILDGFAVELFIVLGADMRFRGELRGHGTGVHF